MILENVSIEFRKKFFQPLIGNWKGIAKTWFKPEELGDTADIRGSIKEVLDGLFLLHDYEGTLMNQKMKGLVIYGFNSRKEQFESIWIDTQHQDSEIMFSTGKFQENKFSVLGNYTNADQKETWG